jgi:hypothetical protein
VSQSISSVRECAISLYAGGPKRWRHDPDADWVSVERAALAHYCGKGWSGDSGEGKIVLSLIKAASFLELPPRHHSTYVEAIYSDNIAFINVRELNIKMGLDPDTPASPSVEAFNSRQRAGLISQSEMIANILTASEQRISNNFKIMTGPGSHTLSFFPTLTLENVLGLYAALGNQRLSQIAEVFGTAPYILRSGWPDLTLWKGSEVVFKEIKSPRDYPRDNQINTIESLVLPFGFDVEFVSVVPRAS